MRLPVTLVFVASLAVLLHSIDAVAQVPKDLVGATPGQVRERLGPPRATEILVEAGKTHWEYGDADRGSFIVTFEIGRVSGVDGDTSQAQQAAPIVDGWRRAEPDVEPSEFLKLLGSSADLPLDGSPSSLYGFARSFVLQERPFDALRLLRRCTEIDAGNRNCRRLREDLELSYRDDLLVALAELADEDLHAREALAYRILEITKLGVQRFRRAAGETARVLSSASDFIDGLHLREEHTRGVAAVALPAELAPYLDYLPELAEAQREVEVHATIADADSQLSLGRVDEAIALMQPHLEHPGAEPTRRRLRYATDGLVERWKEVPPDAPISDLEALLVRLESVPAILFPGVDIGEISRKAEEAVLGQIQGHLGPSVELGLEAMTVAGELELNEAPRLLNLVLGTKDWNIAAELEVAPPDASCMGAVSHQDLWNEIARALPPWLRVGSEAAPISVRVRDVQCAISSSISEPEPVRSTYVASHQQVTNPEYVRLQTELQVAQNLLGQAEVNNAINPNFASGLAVGLWQGNVINLTQSLRQTPPFTSTPVVLSYSAESFEASKTATITANVLFSDEQTDSTDGRSVVKSEDARDRGVRNVLPTDSSRLRNVDPDLPSDAELIAKTVEELRLAVNLSVRSLGERAFIRRAGATHQQGLATVVPIGNLLLADDFNASPSELDSQLLGEIRGAELGNLDRLVNGLEAFTAAAVPTPVEDRPPAAISIGRSGCRQAVADLGASLGLTVRTQSQSRTETVGRGPEHRRRHDAGRRRSHAGSGMQVPEDRRERRGEDRGHDSRHRRVADTRAGRVRWGGLFGQVCLVPAFDRQGCGVR